MTAGQLAEAAGRASAASSIANFQVADTAPPIAGGATVTYDPIGNWNATIDPFTDQLLVAIEGAYQIRGILEGMASRALADERSLVGRVARTLSFPKRVSARLAAEGQSRAVQRTGLVLTAAGQVAVIVIGGLLLFWLEELIGS